MKRQLSILLLFSLVLSLFSCAALPSVSEPSAEQTFATKTVEAERVTLGAGQSPDTFGETVTEENKTREEVPESTHVHSFALADCDTPKTCTLCGKSEGAALGHSFALADCDTPKTCTLCGKSEGAALGHSFALADCDTPKTCTLCGKSEGNALGHRYNEGECSRCGHEDPDYHGGSMVWIPTKGGKKFHDNPNCSNMKGPAYVSEQTARARGFTPCKKCY